jgi:bifunctional enzyme CysN/CysC
MNNLLRFITCGNVDDGKSTLIGHMIYEANLIYADQAKAIQQVQVDGAIDYSLLLDGLMDERAQGITIDVAYRYFNTDKRSFILADTPGHQQYTRNMAVGAAFADLAIILIDASKGIMPQTRRHISITKMMGIRDFVVAINKMDLVNYDESKFKIISDQINNLSTLRDVNSLQIIPLSATKGDNVITVSSNTPYYNGPSLLNLLEQISIKQKDKGEGFVMPIQRIQRSNQGARYLQGEVDAGKIFVGDSIWINQSEMSSRIKSIYRGFDAQKFAGPGEPISIQLNDEIDISRGDVISDYRIPKISSFESKLLWLDQVALDVEKEYYLRIHTKQTLCHLSFKEKIQIDESKPENSNIEMNDLAVVMIETLNDIIALTFEENNTLGGLILVDPISNATVAVGTVLKLDYNPRNLSKFDFSVTPQLRAELKNQKAFTIWFTGLSGSGKSYTSNLLEKTLYQLGYHTMVLDGDDLRSSINKDLGFSIEDRVKNIRRSSEIAKILNDAGIICIISLISPLEEERAEAKRIIGGHGFLEIFMDTPLEICMQRDRKGLYERALRGELKNFTGVDSPYESPKFPDIAIRPEDDLDQKIEEIIKRINKAQQ